jgi:hypothetical protein
VVQFETGGGFNITLYTGVFDTPTHAVFEELNILNCLGVELDLTWEEPLP